MNRVGTESSSGATAALVIFGLMLGGHPLCRS
jgi:hypothetical protein